MTHSSSVYGRLRHGSRRLAGRLTLALAAAAAALPAHAQLDADAVVVDARDALRKKDRDRLASARTLTQAVGHPLAMWVDYWDLLERIDELSQPDIDAFYARWRTSLPAWWSFSST